MKRFLSVVLIFVMVYTFLFSPLLLESADAATKLYNVTGGQLIFDTVKGSVVGYKGNPTNIVIPATISGVKVKKIGLGAFSGCKTLTGVTLPNGLTTIEERVFWECDNLTTINIPDSVTSIGDWFAVYCNKMTAITVGAKNKAYTSQEGVLFSKDKTTLKRYPGGKIGAYTIPSTVKTISIGAFYGCSTLTDVTIPNGVATIGNEAFGNCFRLGNITLPDSLTTLGYLPFAGGNAEEITVGPNNKAFCSIDGVLYNKAKTTLLAFPCVRPGSYAIPEGVTSIFDSAFTSCRYVTDIYMPKTMKKIGQTVFMNCPELQEIYFYGDAPSVHKDAFFGMLALPKILYLQGKKGFTNPWYGCKTEIFQPDLLPPAGQPDLVVTGIKWTPEKPVKGDEVTFSATIKNQGTLTLDAQSISSLVFYVDGQPASAVDTNASLIKPGESVILSANSNRYNGKSTWTATNGTWKISARVDSKMQESRLRNNTFETTLTVTPSSNGSGASSDTFNLRAAASFDVEIVPGINWVPANILGRTLFNNAQIAELAVKAPEEKQSAITNLYEALQLFQVSNFKYVKDNVRIQEGNVYWENHKSGYHAVRTNEGCCASDASWLCYVLKNDYEEMGYIAFSYQDGNGHIYNYIKKDGYYYIIDLEQYEASEQFKNATAPETGILQDFITRGSVMGNLVKVKSLSDYVSYLRKTMRNAPGLFVTYPADTYIADTVIPSDSIRVSYDRGLTSTMQITYPKGANITVLYDDPNDNMSLGYAEAPKQIVDWSKIPTATIIPQTDF